MGLQVRFRHAARERILDLPERTASSPLVIGRGPEADLRIPADGMAPRHAALYVENGRWIIAGLAGVVTLAGQPLTAPAKLRSGDLIALGADASAPTLEIDPNRPAQAPASAVAGAPLPASVSTIAAPVARNPAPPPKPAPAPAPAPAPTRASTRPVEPQLLSADASDPPADPSSSDESGDAIDWDPQVPLPASPEFYVPKPRKTPVLAIVITLLLAGAACAIAGRFIYLKLRQPRVVIVRQEPAPTPQPISTPKLMDPDRDQELARQAHAHDHDAPAPPSATTRLVDSPDAPTPAIPSSSTPPDRVPPAKPVAPEPAASIKEESLPDPNDAEWNEIRNAHFNVRHQGVAILKFDEYRRDHPGKFTTQLDQYLDQAVDWLYWQRVAQLWKRQDDLVAEIRQKARDVRTQPAGAFHDQLVKEEADLRGKADQTKQLLTIEMGYHGDVPPDLESPRQLKTLADSRDPAAFLAFRKHVLKYVRDNHGSTWWDGE